MKVRVGFGLGANAAAGDAEGFAALETVVCGMAARLSRQATFTDTSFSRQQHNRAMTLARR